jgi:ribosomal protein L17
LNDLWKASRDLKALNANLKAISEAPDGFITEQFIQSHIPKIRELLRSIESLIHNAKRKGLMNRSLTSAPLGMIRSRGEYIADYLEALEMSIDQEVLEAIDEGRSQIERGEFEVMDGLF